MSRRTATRSRTGCAHSGSSVSTVVACIDARRFRKVDPDVTTRALWAALHGVTSLLIQMPQFTWGDQKAVVSALIDGLMDGLRPRR